MSVAETPKTEQVSQNPQQQLAIASALGAVIVLLGLSFVLGGFPWLWSVGWEQVFPKGTDLHENVFLRGALLILVDVVLIAGLAYAAYRALQVQMPPGARAGIFFFAVYLLVCLTLVTLLGGQLEHGLEDQPMVGLIVMVVIFAAAMAAAAYVYMKVPAWTNFLVAAEDQGWFHATSYKGNQGVRVRRGTIVGVLAVGVAGIITMVSHRYFGYERAAAGDQPALYNDLHWVIPFTDPMVFFPLVVKMHVILPIVLGVLLIWVAWRVANIPAFADFLIATEAEMNKVSWTNRKRLFQDTIVVLTTVILMTAFLFFVDMIWIRVLMLPGINVLQIDPIKAQEKQQEQAQW